MKDEDFTEMKLDSSLMRETFSTSRSKTKHLTIDDPQMRYLLEKQRGKRARVPFSLAFTQEKSLSKPYNEIPKLDIHRAKSMRQSGTKLQVELYFHCSQKKL